MYYPDLSPCTYFDFDDPADDYLPSSVLRAVGWLEHGRSYATGPTPPIALETLQHMLLNPWPGSVFFGPHTCDLCVIQCPGLPPAAGRDLFVPGEAFVYATPGLVHHYALDHGYQLPAQFCEALMACPPLGTKAYFDAVKQSGGADLFRFMSAISRFQVDG